MSDILKNETPEKLNEIGYSKLEQTQFEEDENKRNELYEEAIKLFEKSYKDGVVNAGINLANIYEGLVPGIEGEWDYKDYKFLDLEKAAEIYKEIYYSENSSSKAGFNYAVMLFDGRGVKQDYKEAFQIFVELAETDNENSIPSCFMVALMYENGYGIDKNLEEAFKYYKYGAEQNDPYSLLHLGRCYFDGIGIKEDKEKAVFYYKRALKFGDGYGALNLANCYEKGMGVEIDYDKAREYYQEAINLSIPEAKDEYDRFLKEGGIREKKFYDTLLSFIEGKNRKEVSVYREANLQRQHFSKIKTNPEYSTSKNTCLKLALALSLNLEETKKLLASAGYAFKQDKKDIEIQNRIEKGDQKQILDVIIEKEVESF